MGSTRKALTVVGLSRSTWHYRAKPRAKAAQPVAHKDRAYPSRITAEQRAVVEAHVTAGWQAGHSVDHSFAAAWDDGVMVASRRSWWRITKDIADQSARPVAPTRRTACQPRQAPVLRATGPNQVWSWDITDLHSPWRGKSFKAYSIIDIYSRKLVGWRVEDREADHLAVEMFATAISEHGAPHTVHADSGPAMRSNLLGEYLTEQGITRTHNRPSVSNDNPYSESEFRTMKYRPNYPGIFGDIDVARAYIDWYAPWYNGTHRHSGIGLFTPNEVHDGTWHSRWQARSIVQDAYYQAHPERFRTRPRTAQPATLVGINLPTDTKTQAERLHAA